MKNRNCLTKPNGLFRPIAGREIGVIRRSESFLNVCGLARIQTRQAGSAIAARLGFRFLRQMEKINAPGEQLIYHALRHTMILQINEAKVLEGLLHARSCGLKQRKVAITQSSEINDWNLFTGA